MRLFRKLFAEKIFRLYDKVYPAVKEQMKELAEM